MCAPMRIAALRLSLAPSTSPRSGTCQRGLEKKTQFLLRGELRERLRDSIGRQLFKSIGFLLFIPNVIVGRKEIMIDDGMSVLVKKREFGIGRRAGLVRRPIDFVAARVLALTALRGKENRIVVALRVVVWLVRVVLPLLHEKDARLCASVRLERVAVQADDGEDAALVRDVAANLLVGGVVEAALRKDNCHASARAKEVDVSFDEKDIAADALLRLAVLRAGSDRRPVDIEFLVLHLDDEGGVLILQIQLIDHVDAIHRRKMFPQRLDVFIFFRLLTDPAGVIFTLKRHDKNIPADSPGYTENTQETGRSYSHSIVAGGFPVMS